MSQYEDLESLEKYSIGKQISSYVDKVRKTEADKEFTFQSNIEPNYPSIQDKDQIPLNYGIMEGQWCALFFNEY